jgi:hypothetical protein
VLLKGRNCEIAGRHGDVKPVRGCERSLVSCGLSGRKGDFGGFGGRLKLELCLFVICSSPAVCDRVADAVEVVFVSCLKAISKTEIPHPWPTRARRIVANVWSV